MGTGRIDCWGSHRDSGDGSDAGCTLPGRNYETEVNVRIPVTVGSNLFIYVQSHSLLGTD